MKHKNVSNLEWIPWHRYALLLRIDGGQIAGLGRFRLAISAHKVASRLDNLKGYKTRVVDTKECAIVNFYEAYEKHEKQFTVHGSRLKEKRD